jgi:hypothetical protein
MWKGTHLEAPQYASFYLVTSSLLGTNILLSTLFSNILKQCEI